MRVAGDDSFEVTGNPEVDIARMTEVLNKVYAHVGALKAPARVTIMFDASEVDEDEGAF